MHKMQLSFNLYKQECVFAGQRTFVSTTQYINSHFADNCKRRQQHLRNPFENRHLTPNRNNKWEKYNQIFLRVSLIVNFNEYHFKSWLQYLGFPLSEYNNTKDYAAQNASSQKRSN